MSQSDAPLTLVESSRGKWTIIEVVGDLDLATAPQLSEAVRTDNGSSRSVAFDMSGVRFVDSSGLRTMLDIRKDGVTDIRLIAPSSAVADLLDLTRLTDAFEIIESSDQLESP